MTTTKQPPTECESDAMPGSGDPDLIWCICGDDPETALCGASMNGPIVPNEEVPDEQTCPECLRIEKLIEAAVGREES